MLALCGKRQKFCDGLSRRNFLKIGAFGAGLTLAEMLRGRALATTGASNQAAIATITLIIIRGPLAGQHYAFDKPTTCVVGRARDCTISLPLEGEYADVSRHHCLLDISPPAVRARDLGSTNGTFVNGRKIGQRDSRAAPGNAGQAGSQIVELSAGDEIQLGFHTAFRVSVSPPPEPDIRKEFVDAFPRLFRLTDHQVTFETPTRG